MSRQLLILDSAGSSQSGSSASVSSTTASESPPPSDSASASSYGHDDDTEWCVKVCRRSRGRRGGRRKRHLHGTAVAGGVVKKKVKNAREKERVKDVRQRYEELSMVLGDNVERGSGHFSKVRALAAACRRLEELMETLTEAEEKPSNAPDHCDERSTTTASDSPGVNLNCEERLEPMELYTSNYQSSSGSTSSFDLLPDLQELEHLSPELSATPYFSYSSPDFPAVFGDSSMMFPFTGNSPGPVLPPSSSLISPELINHSIVPGPAVSGTLSPLGLSPPTQHHSYHCGDIWLAIGCQ